MKQISKLMEEDPDADSEDGRILKSLADDISEYEKHTVVKFDLENMQWQQEVHRYRMSTEMWYRVNMYAHQTFWGALRWIKDIRYNLRRAKWYFVRGKRGWAPNDTWELSGYLETVIKESLRYMADNANGWPGTERFPTYESWQEFLREVSQSIEDYQKEDDDCEYDDIMAKAAKETAAYEAMQGKLHELVDVWSALWD